LQLHIDVAPALITSWQVFLGTSPHPWAPPLSVILAERFSADERQFFEQIDQDGFEQRQGAQILAEQIEAGLRRRRSICLPGRAGCLKFLFGDVDGRRLPLAKPLKLDHREVNQTKLQPGDSLRMRPEIIE